MPWSVLWDRFQKRRQSCNSGIVWGGPSRRRGRRQDAAAAGEHADPGIHTVDSAASPGQCPTHAPLHDRHSPSSNLLLLLSRLCKLYCKTQQSLCRPLIPYDYHPSCILGSSSSNLLQVSRTNLTFDSRSVRAAAPTLWKCLPDSIHSSIQYILLFLAAI